MLSSPANSEPASQEPGGAADDSIGSILRGILMDLRTLIRDEVALARVEIGRQAGRARGAALSFGIAATSLAFGATFLLIALATAIADAFDWPVWAGFILVAILLSLIGLITMASGRKQLQRLNPIPTETVATLKENSEWIAKRLSSVQK